MKKQSTMSIAVYSNWKVLQLLLSSNIIFPLYYLKIVDFDVEKNFIEKYGNRKLKKKTVNINQVHSRSLGKKSISIEKIEINMKRGWKKKLFITDLFYLEQILFQFFIYFYETVFTVLIQHLIYHFSIEIGNWLAFSITGILISPFKYHLRSNKN